MQNRPLELRRTIRVHAAMVGLAWRSHHIAAAHRTMLGHFELLMTARMFFIFDHLHYLGDHIAAALDLDPVANFHAEFVDEIHVMQRRPRHGRTSDWNGFQPSHRRKLSGAANLRTISSIWVTAPRAANLYAIAH